MLNTPMAGKYISLPSREQFMSPIDNTVTSFSTSILSLHARKNCRIYFERIRSAKIALEVLELRDEFAKLACGGYLWTMAVFEGENREVAVVRFALVVHLLADQ